MAELRYKEYGIVKSSAGCIATGIGFQNCFLGQLVKFGYGTEGIIMGFDLEEALILLVKENEPIKPGNQIIATLEPFNMPAGDGFIGRMVNPLGEALDGMAPVKPDKMIPYFNKVPAIMDREGLRQTLETGVKLIDTMLPLGHGQRSLILGDKMTGKTTVGTDIILNQKGKDVICIYCAIGKPRSAMSRVVDLFKEKGCFDYTVIMSAPASSSPGQQFLAPYAACALGDYFMYKGKRVFVLFDDFTKHAWAYRELSLLMQVPPGRDSYPGDIFYLHSRMIERAAQLNKELGSGSMTFIPIVELLEGDLTAYVPTNLVSMTDGQIFLSMPLFNEGFRPAVDVGLSVSRVGSRVQWDAMKTVAKSLRLEFIQFKELLRVSKLQTGGQSDEMRDKLSGGKILQTLLTQPPNSPVSQETQIICFYAKNENLLNEMDKDQVTEFQSGIFDWTLKNDGSLLPLLRAERKLVDELKSRITKVVQSYVADIKSRKKVEDDDVETG
ncbi:MAG: F0F1 ATP synthase subunit alpha [Candidatus Omnitrophica bacterium CG11_big_fil_rev_8_21_14_0_20_45_26]|uniref:F0F1 ATP synthase subunit alpha n=1 Tax=Candidatus Abzuiibacterium crystallinum TaxID=1974748 RepID=A0A2H0LR42_9BACT|nr:MAG: F0F1 ATP synthase subunit alpha [Candidatus Omnitrophica bacterium CG11_big_fil_rev_8_21_14_0_20_45_26]PIW64711.1 MAG: F0F1 ATP synthase subunit alpha [Candidatus Omnitrophica bacterium CG12_big_fil_rev_8_21_14_0_65_45_16]